MTSIRRRVLLMLAAALVCTWVTAFAVRPSREAIRAVAAYAPDIAQGIVYDDWLVGDPWRFPRGWRHAYPL